MDSSVSLIITTYNRKDALELVLLSAFRQSVLPAEIIVADDGSREDTAALVHELQKISPVKVIHCWHQDAGFRLSAIRNRAIALTRSEYIIMIDGDIIMPPDFIKFHLRQAKPGRFVQGTRIFLKKRRTKVVLAEKQIDFNFFSWGIRRRLNTLYVDSMVDLISYRTKDLKKVRGCNQSFWKSDVVKINGFNEDFEGWGREDTEFTVRMLNNNIEFYKIKMGGAGYHLYHPKSSRRMLPKNITILDEAIRTGSKRCRNGLDKYLAAPQADPLT